MSRRDTIIIAALINAGLLIILFVSALKNQDAPQEMSFKNENNDFGNSAVVVRNEAKLVMGDEVDQVLKQYSQPDPLQTTTSPATTESAPLAAQTAPGASDVIPLPAAPPSNFVDDLQAITQSPAAVTSAAAASEEKSYIEVKVKKGDVLEKIARHHHSSVAEIMKLNNLHSTNLKIGQVLKIPSKSPTIAKAPSQTAAPASSTDGGSVKYYTVKPGDNPWTIAVKNHMKVEDLLKLNNMDEGKAKKLKPGDQIRIR